MHHRPFQQVDVFTATAYRGNPLAVVLDGTGLSTEEMQQFTRWTNLSEADVALIARGLGVVREDIVQHAWCDNGPGWRAVLLASSAQVLALKPDAAILAGLDVGVVGPAAGSGASAPRGKVGVVGRSDADGIAFEVRAFFPGNNGLAEDPVTGSLNAALAQWLIGAGLAPAQYVASQGTCLGRAGRVHVQQEGDTIWVGGHSVTCMAGEALL